MAKFMLSVARLGITRFEARLLQVLGLNPKNDAVPGGALDVVGIQNDTKPSQPQDAKSVLDEVFGNGILWAAVPKTRISLERRHKRRLGHTKIEKWTTPKKNIVSCLECGHWHEAHTLCGNCYSKVREETERMRTAMKENDRLYDHPKKEIVYLYQGEEREKHSDKYIVELKTKRPNWWPKNLLTKYRNT